MSLTPLPTLDQLATAPARVQALPPEVARDLLLQLAPLQEALRLQALSASAGNGPPEPSTPKEEDRWLPPEEAAAYLGLTVAQLRRRNIPRKKIGHRTVRYSRAVLKRHMARA